MKVIDEGQKGVSEGQAIALEELGLPAPDKGLLIVFWKGQ